MTFQTGTVTNLNDLLDQFATFLAAAGWTIVGNWREPMLMSIGTFVGPGGSEPDYVWRWGRRLHVQKGTKCISMQDFYVTKDIEYGTNGTLNAGPGIAASISTSINAQPAIQPLASDYDGTGPAQFPTFTQPGASGSVNGIIRTVIMPLPTLVSQVGGTWRASTHVMSETVVGLPGPFGVPGGAAIPLPYWFMSDATGDNVIMAVLRGGDAAFINRTPYLYFGELRKGGVWTGGNYLGASHGNNNCFISAATFGTPRFGPPGAMADGFSIHTLLRADVDSFINKYIGLSTNIDPNVQTGKSFSSTTSLLPKNDLGDPSSGVFGIEANGLWYGSLRFRRSIVGNAAPLLPTYWVAKRDVINGVQMYSLLGVLPNIYQAETTGFSPGTEWAARDGTVYVIFDGYAVTKVP